MTPIDRIRNAVNQYGVRIGIPVGKLKVYDSPQVDGTPYINISENIFSYIIEERGCIFEKRETSDFNTLLYWLMSDVVFTMASNYELNHRVPHQDSRRVIFSTELKLMQALEESWNLKKKNEIEDNLEKSPYIDNI
ncbi:hypothetical protein RD110_17595 [Rhodoferax koreense]|uniref:Immunity protein 63 domain-containing protein n=1 Tax=Rhodoferax koreensis TaxID=1842727 RepID=A0A1P8JYG8_9BURK|nr:Imm63 family immunity protein [Rhodoferax koreense]APW38797.1 hypothetical protein RD110_17595 [Rhodoferax koreense]